MSEFSAALDREHPHLPCGHLYLASGSLAGAGATSVGFASCLVTGSRVASLTLTGSPFRGILIAGSLVCSYPCGSWLAAFSYRLLGSLLCGPKMIHSQAGFGSETGCAGVTSYCRRI